MLLPAGQTVDFTVQAQLAADAVTSTTTGFTLSGVDLIFSGNAVVNCGLRFFLANVGGRATCWLLSAFARQRRPTLIVQSSSMTQNFLRPMFVLIRPVQANIVAGPGHYYNPNKLGQIIS